MHSKGNHKQNKKITHRIRENICKQGNQQGSYLQNMQIPHVAKYQKNLKSNKKIGRTLK